MKRQLCCCRIFFFTYSTNIIAKYNSKKDKAGGRVLGTVLGLIQYYLVSAIARGSRHRLWKFEGERIAPSEMVSFKNNKYLRWCFIFFWLWVGGGGRATTLKKNVL